MRFRLLPESSRLGWTPYAWLVYLSFYLAYSTFSNDSAADWALDALVVCVFLVLYFRGYWVRGTALLRVAFGIWTLGALLGPRNPGASCFVIYAAAFVGEIAPARRAIRWLLILAALIALEAYVLRLSIGFWLPAVIFSLLIGGSNVHYAEMRRKDAALIKAHEAAEQMAAVAERERIARDLHDLLGHTLSVIVLKSELAAKLADRDPPRAAAEIREVERISRHALAEVRRAIHGYRGERFTDELASGRKVLESAGITLTAAVDPVPLGVDEERALALALREAFTNVVRHSGARICRVALRQEPTCLRLVVEDDGVGGVFAEGAGMSGMRARVAALGGRVTWDGRSGMRLTLDLPSVRQTPSGALAAS